MSMFADPIAPGCAGDILGESQSQTLPRHLSLSGSDVGIHDERDSEFDARYGFNEPISASATKELLHPDVIQERSLPYRIVKNLAASMNLGETDHLLDIVSGRGRLAIMLHELTGALVQGIDPHPTFVTYARERAGTKQQISFQEAHPLNVNLGSPTVVFLINPFRGNFLEGFLIRLHNQFANETNRPRIVGQGLCALSLNEKPWLQKVSDSDGIFAPAVYEIVPARPGIPSLRGSPF